MNRRELLLLAAGAALAGCASPIVPSARPPASGTTTASGADAGASGGFDAFCDALMARLAPAPDDLVLSPWSIATVLAMVREGAAGTTADELTAVLGGPPPALARLLPTGAGSALEAGNALWGQRDLTWKQPFLDRLADSFDAPLHQSDFRADPDAVRREINAWVEDRTKGKIPELLSAGMLDVSTRLVLVNAVHFAAPWHEPLAELGPRPFTTAAGRRVEVPTLAGTTLRPWWSGDGVSGSAITCEGGEYALVLVLPDDAASGGPVPVATFARVLSADPALVAVQLPAWTLRFRQELSAVLRQLGIPTAFDPRAADFSGMTDQEKLFLDFVVHEATVEVNAKGIEAAAATAGGMAAAGAPTEPRSLVLDRPFSWALMHAPTRTCLFLGRVGDPARTSVG